MNKTDKTDNLKYIINKLAKVKYIAKQNTKRLFRKIK